MAVAASEKAQKTLRNAERAAREQLKSDLRSVMGTLAGRRFLWHILDDLCQLHGGSFTGNSTTFYNEGRRSVAIDVMKLVQQFCPETYVDMVREQIASADSQRAVQATAAQEAEEGDDA